MLDDETCEGHRVFMEVTGGQEQIWYLVVIASWPFG